MAVRHKNQTLRRSVSNIIVRKQPITISLATIATLLVVSMVTSGVFISYLWRQQAVDANVNTTNLILEATDGLTSPVPVD